MILRFYDLLFYRMYKVTYRTNKSITEWSTIIWLSVLISLNIISALIYIGFPVIKLKRIGFMAIPLIVIFFNYLYFLKNSRYLEVLKEYDKTFKKYWYVDVFSFIYASASFVFFYKMLGLADKYIWIVLLVLTLVSLISYLIGKNSD